MFIRFQHFQDVTGVHSLQGRAARPEGVRTLQRNDIGVVVEKLHFSVLVRVDIHLFQ